VTRTACWRGIEAALLVALLGAGPACRAREAVRKDDPAAATTATPAVASAQPVVTDMSAGQTYTWIDAKCNHASATAAKDVETIGREVVRVEDRGTAAPEEAIFVADLRNARADGTYSVRLMSKDEWDDLAGKCRAKLGIATLERSKGRTPTPGPAEPAQPSAPGTRTDTEPRGSADVAASAPVIIYGASWCGPCHQAADYLKKKGVRYVLKDIEEDSSAQREMTIKLAKAGMRGSGIPVIDVKGQILVGFSAARIDAALAARPDRPI
jgi:glutaredoxin